MGTGTPIMRIGHRPLYTIDEIREAFMVALVGLYSVNSAQCAHICDDELDHSGHLLGDVRERVYERAREDLRR